MISDLHSAPCGTKPDTVKCCPGLMFLIPLAFEKLSLPEKKAAGAGWA